MPRNRVARSQRARALEAHRYLPVPLRLSPYCDGIPYFLEFHAHPPLSDCRSLVYVSFTGLAMGLETFPLERPPCRVYSLSGTSIFPLDYNVEPKRHCETGRRACAVCAGLDARVGVIALTNLPFLLLLLLHSVLAEDFDCKPTLEGRPYDLTSLGNGEHVVNRTRDTPPTQMIDSLAFDLCGDLKAKETLSEQDQCPAGTRACLTQVNVKEKVERVVSVIPLAQSSKLDPQLTVSSKKYLTLLFHGPEYPQPPAEQQSLAAPSQSLNLTLWCDPQLETPKITILGYDGSQLQLEYFGIAGCPTSNGTNPPDEGKDPDGGDKEPTGSGIGWFFLLYCIFSLDNALKEGPSHRDFWQEVPYMLRDVVSHMCSSARPRRSTRGGYISV
ncbi:hypothetical protein D9611_000239 [Ephemerocybe angulata]|uniref:Autophagy-related protein 27 n=1 Tax=Ephemerocybe angulata TaxID=980116 RepID=A0A8H5BNE6_9AGAR|nr:hypothetical protein D9611_000239 [Tulosesus angulatus]